MAKKSTTNEQIIEKVFYGLNGNDQVAIYRAKIGGEWIYNFTAKDLRKYNATDTESYQRFDNKFYDMKSYEQIQTSETWFNRFDDVLDELKDRNWPLVWEIHVHPDFRERLEQEVDSILEFIRETWDRACYPDQIP